MAKATAAGCEGYTVYESLNMLGGVCFGPPASLADARIADLSLLSSLRQMTDFKAVAFNAKVQLTPIKPKKLGSLLKPPTSSGGGATTLPSILTPQPAIYNWGLDRSDQTRLPLDNDVSQCPNGGANVELWMLDTGCRVTHQEYRGRATTESVFINGAYAFPSGADGHGHGSHTAGIAAGKW